MLPEMNITEIRVSLSKIEIFGPRYFLDLPSQHVSERVVFGPFAVTRGRKLLETFSDLQIFSVPLFMTRGFMGGAMAGSVDACEPCLGHEHVRIVSSCMHMHPCTTTRARVGESVTVRQRLPGM